MSRAKLHLAATAIAMTVAVVCTGCAAPLSARETGIEELYLEVEQIPIDNCGGPAEVTVNRSMMRTIRHDVYVETASDVNLDAMLVSTTIGQRYGVQNGSAETRSFGVSLTAPAHSKVVYVLQWKEVWIKGIVYDPGSGKTQGSFRLRKDIHMQIIDSHTEACS